MLQIKRVYEHADASDGNRFLVDRLWPRGIKKEALNIDAWLKDVAPSYDLLRWFAHDPLKWDEFQKRYRDELRNNPAAWKPIIDALKRDNVTLLYSSRNTAHNNASELKSFIEEQNGVII